MKFLRVIVAGPVSSGKSTFVKTASDTGVIETERFATDSTSLLKPQTTVAFDFSRLILSPEMELHIYGTPGQSRFDFMWDLLIQRADAYILLVAAHRADDFSSAREILTYMHQRVQLPMLIGLTHTDCPNAKSVEDVTRELSCLNDVSCPSIVTVNPMDKTSVFNILMMIKSHILKEVDIS
ncbi:MAG: ATP/GTP-binding protein [Coleofasciculus sp. A1-SPW-01]|uniref:GTP-binding protein n=1 Tax=Coleofasciculus sp. A1-SPW-01 TaxID=3070819 RepID=UPI003303726C